MSNAISYILRYIKRNIPEKILKEAFMKDHPYTRSGVRNLDSLIKEKVFDGIVKPDIDTTGGREMLLDVGRMSPLATETNGLVYKIPMSMTNGAAITSCRFASFVQNNTATVGYGSSVSYGANVHSPNLLANTLSTINYASTPDPVTGTADCHVLDSGANTVFIKCRNRQKIYWLQVDVENDSQLNHISPKSYHEIAKLCLYATQAYIYTKLVIEMGSGYISGGAELGPFKDIVDGYSDANANYDDYLREVIEVVLMLNDPRKKEEHYFFPAGGRRF